MHFLNTRDAQHSGKDFLNADVVSASLTAVPLFPTKTLFPISKAGEYQTDASISCIDGGIGAHVLGTHGVIESIKKFKEDKKEKIDLSDIVLVSLRTGSLEPKAVSLTGG